MLIEEELTEKIIGAAIEVHKHWGPGLYEEIFFRLILAGGLFLLLKKVLALPGALSAAISILISAAVFSLFHHIGHGSPPIDGVYFFYRFLAGIFLSAVFILRGFAAAVYTHALYDIFVLLRDM